MGMVGVSVAGLRMHQNRKLRAIQHEPRDNPGKFVRRKLDLVHRDRMRPDGLVAPAPHLDGEVLLELLADMRGGLTRTFIVINVGVITFDSRGVDSFSHYAFSHFTKVREKTAAGLSKPECKHLLSLLNTNQHIKTC